MVYPIVDPTELKLARGDRHGAVRVLQSALNQRGAALAVDGDFGQRTERAVRKFQFDEERVQGVTGGIAATRTLDALHILREVGDILQRSPIQHSDTADWRAGIGFEKINLGQTVIDPNTGKRVPAIGTGFKAIGYEKLIGGRVTYFPGKVWTFHGKDDPDRTQISNNECALFSQVFGVGGTAIGGTKNWRRGPQVKALGIDPTTPVIPAGTVIATLRDGYYLNDHSGRSHTGIFHSFIWENGKKTGFRMYDQSNGADIALRTYKFFDTYDRYALKPGGSKKGDFTVPVYDEAGRFIGLTTVYRDDMKKFKYKTIGIGDEYYVVYADGKDAVTWNPW